jgi:hypothetical protein
VTRRHRLLASVLAPAHAARMTSFSRTALALALAGCAASPGPADAPLPTDDAPERCDTDTACPYAAPVWGGGCEGILTCRFGSMCGPTSEDVYECVGGTWTLTMPAPCAGAPPPLAESCRTPSTAPIPGARLWLSADSAGAPELSNGDLVDIAFGAQGLAMIPYRVHVEADAPPTCARVTATLTLETVAGTAVVHDVRLRCGDSLRIQDILPGALPCEEREYAVGLDVMVEGVGSVSLDLRAMGGGCMFGG